MTMTSLKTLEVAGTLRVPGDKSISHRALMLAALGSGTSRVTGLLRSADVDSTAGVLRALGVNITMAVDGAASVTGRGLRGLHAAPSSLDCGNSGTTTRLMAGILAAHPFSSRFVGDASLSKRPMRRVSRPLTAMGARVDFEGSGDGLPITVHGAMLSGIDWESENSSAQVKSAILLAGLVAGVAVSVREPERSRDHTERMLRARGVDVVVDGTTVRIAPAGHLAPCDVDVPGDPSSAAFFLALGALADRGSLGVRGVCLNPTRIGAIAVLRRMGATIDVEHEEERGGERVGDLRVAPGGLRGTTIEGDEIPTLIDELPLIACVAARADGETVIRGAAELRVKESDRITAVVANLRAIGVEAEELPDGMRIVGSRSALEGSIRTHADHRLAMAFGILDATPGARLTIDDPDCVGVSYPGFWSDLAHVTA